MLKKEEVNTSPKNEDNDMSNELPLKVDLNFERGTPSFPFGNMPQMPGPPAGMVLPPGIPPPNPALIA
jgi:hypothetical protein